MYLYFAMREVLAIRLWLYVVWHSSSVLSLSFIGIVCGFEIAADFISGPFGKGCFIYLIPDLGHKSLIIMDVMNG